MVRLLNHPLAVPPPWRAGADGDAVVFRDGGERGRHPPGLGTDHGRHPVEPPVPAQPPESTGDPVKALDEVGLILGLAQHAPPPTGVAQRANEQVRVLAPPPLLRRVGQLDPVPLGLRTRRVLDHRDRPTRRRGARLARRAQPASSQRPGHRRIGPVVAQVDQLVEQGRGPQMRVVGQPLTRVANERVERIRAATNPNPRLPASQVGADGLTVPAKVAGDRGDRPPLPSKSVHVDVVLPCEHERRGSFELVSGQRPPASKGPPPHRRSHTGGDFQ